MLQAFMIVLRESFEAFLIVSVITAYLLRIGRSNLLSAAYWGIASALALSAALGFVMAKGVNEPLWEGILGLTAAVMVSSLVIQMWRQGRFVRSKIESRLQEASTSTSARAWWGVFLFTAFMIAREGMETALMLIQVPQKEIFSGAAAAVAVTVILSVLWARLSRLIDLGLFFQVTGIFLLLFALQIGIYGLHELSEAGILKGAESFHHATEPFGPAGVYGRWYPVFMVAVCAGWLMTGWVRRSAR